MEERHRKFLKKINEKEELFDSTNEALLLAEIKADEKAKLLRTAEEDIKQLERTLILKEAEVERSEETLGSSTTNVGVVSKRADASHKIRKELEMENARREDAIEQLERKLKEAQFLAVEAERKYDEVYRKMNMLDGDLEKALFKADACEDKIVELEVELQYVGDSMKAMEVSEEKASHREDVLKDQIRNLTSRLKEAERRAEYGEMNVQRVHLSIDQLEDELIVQKSKSKAINDELQSTFNDMSQLAMHGAVNPPTVNGGNSAESDVSVSDYEDENEAEVESDDDKPSNQMNWYYN